MPKKLELIEWLTRLEDEDTIQYLKIVKDSKSDSNDWWGDLPVEHQNGIKRCLSDIEAGRVVSRYEVKTKYGL